MRTNLAEDASEQPSEPPKRRRGNPNMRPGAPSVNPNGRPRVGQSLAEAYREKYSPEKIVELAGKLAESAQSEQVRLAALQMISERAHGKVTTVIDASITNGQQHDDFSHISLERRREIMNELDAGKTIEVGTDGEEP